MWWYVGGYVLCILLAWGAIDIHDRVEKSRGATGWEAAPHFWMGILWPLLLLFLALFRFVDTWERFANYVAYRITYIERVKRELGVNE